MSNHAVRVFPPGADAGAAWRVLILAPFGRDGVLLSNLLNQAGIAAEPCADMPALCLEIEGGVGAVLVADEALAPANRKLLVAVVQAQPAWSDLPIFVMTPAGEIDGRRRLQQLQPLGNLTMLERPLRVETVISSFRMGLRARAHQYQLRDHLEAERLSADALRASESSYRSLAEAMPQLVWTCLPDGDCDYLSRQWVDYTGVPDGDQLGMALVRRSIHPDDLQRTELAWSAAVRGIGAGECVYDVEYRLRRYDGVYRWFKARAVPVRDAAGKVQKWYGTCTDIEEQRRALEEQAAIARDNARLYAEAQLAQETLRRSNMDLRRANEDLNQFAYSASHDLQEPLRMVAIYSQMLQRKYGDKLDEQAKAYLNYSVQGARRMEMLLKNLLEYTQVADGAPEEADPVDSAKVLQRAAENLSEAVQQAQATLRVMDLPVLKVKEIHLLQLFQNLLGNALKYRSNDLPVITVCAIRDGAMWRLCVKDNGIGIDKQYANQVFGLFKRLHGGGSQYEGTGIGLAICQKIVERYGGTIWVESEGEGTGSAFCFTLPGVAGAPTAAGVGAHTAGR